MARILLFFVSPSYTPSDFVTSRAWSIQHSLVQPQLAIQNLFVDFIVTTNLPFSKWTELFENTTMVAALVDRLTFRSHVLDMNGDSYRLRSALQGRP